MIILCHIFILIVTVTIIYLIILYVRLPIFRPGDEVYIKPNSGPYYIVKPTYKYIGGTRYVLRDATMNVVLDNYPFHKYELFKKNN